MDRVELKLRVIFSTAALVAALAVMASIVSGLAGHSVPWSALFASGACLGLGAPEALGRRRMGTTVTGRLLLSVLLGVACLALLERLSAAALLQVMASTPA